MIFIILLFFALVVLLGAILLTYVIQKRKPPRWLVMIHGPFAFLSILLLIIQSFRVPDGEDYIWTIIVFCVTAAGGLYLIYQDFTKPVISRKIAIMHGIFAISAFLLLILNAFN